MALFRENVRGAPLSCLDERMHQDICWTYVLAGIYFFSKTAREDKVHPVATICIYYGKAPYDGPEELYQMIEYENFPKNMYSRGFTAEDTAGLLEESFETVEKWFEEWGMGWK